MKVKELIKELKKMDKNLEVVTEADKNGYFGIDEVVIYKNDDEEEEEEMVSINRYF